MRMHIVTSILRKELLDTSRDKRTLFMMIVLPVLLYPATLLIGTQAMLVRQQWLETTELRVALVAEAPNDVDVMKSWIDGLYSFKIIASKDPDMDLAEGILDAIVVARAPLLDTFNAGYTLPIDILYDITEFKSMEAADRLDSVFREVLRDEQSRRLKSIAIDAQYINPIEIHKVDMAPREKAAGSLIGLILPGLLVVVMALGAFYPAVDLTAGEKERGTFETLLSTPASKMEIVTGKFLTVFIMTMLTALLNLASMAATFTVLFAQISTVVGEQFSLVLQDPVRVCLTVVIIVVPLALMLSALMMSVAVFARSFREAQNYLTPVLMLILLPAMIAATPGTSLTVSVQFIPIVNTVILFKDVMMGKATIESIFAVFISTSAFALLALSFAAKIFQREDIILSEAPAMPLTLRRGEYVPRTAPTTGFALTLFGLVMLLIFYAGAWAQQKAALPGLLLTEWGLILVPVVGALWYARVNLRQALRLRFCGFLQTLGGMSLAVASLILVLGFSALHDHFLPVPDALNEEFKRFLDGVDSNTGLVMILFAMAVSPAICEEVLFRGALLSGLSQRLRPLYAILTVAVLFGIFHLSVYRFAPTALLGLAITYAVWRTNSLWTGVIMHFINNATSILLMTGKLPTPISEFVLPPSWQSQGPSREAVLLALLALAIGVILIEFPARRRRLLGTVNQ